MLNAHYGAPSRGTFLRSTEAHTFGAKGHIDVQSFGRKVAHLRSTVLGHMMGHITGTLSGHILGAHRL
jgi:hypothetical protein